MIKIALAKGRLLEPSLKIFESLGYDVREARESRKLVIQNRNVRFLFAKPMDCPSMSSTARRMSALSC